jgi:hypothetical protein
VLRQFRSAVAVLRGDWEELRRLIDEFSHAALLEAAELVRIHVDDMRELLDEHHAFFATQRDHTLFMEDEQQALDLVAKLGNLSGEVIERLSSRADNRMRAGMRIDRSDVREFLTEADETSIAALVHGLAAPAPFVMALATERLFEALMESSERVRARPPRLPAPVAPRRHAPERRPDATQRIRAELVELAAPTTVAEFTVRETWGVSIGRHSALVDAYSRFDGLPGLDHEPGVDEPDHGEVWRVSRSTIEGGT